MTDIRDDDPLSDAELDDVLARARPTLPVQAVRTSELMARDRVATGLPAGRRTASRRRRTVLSLGAGVLLLTGAGTVTAYQLSIPPFQGLEPGLHRSAVGVPVEYRTDAGTEVSCLIFVESRGLSGAQQRRIDSMIRQTNWRGYGQQVYESLPAADRAVQTGPGPVGDVVSDELERRAAATDPGVSLRAASGATVVGSATSCTYPAGSP